ncbi:FAD dependent oxidoreductase domain protein [Acinetobacter sp. 1592897]|nr:FAD dependent oxidoreductase domain protein [Acinetobacter sp. 1592897]
MVKHVGSGRFMDVAKDAGFIADHLIQQLNVTPCIYPQH